MSSAPLPKLMDLDDPDFDPDEAEMQEFGEFTDTYDRLHSLRRGGDVQLGDLFSYFMNKQDESLTDVTTHMILGYDLCHYVLNDAATFTNEAFKITLGQSFGEKSLTMLDAPEHTRYRRIFQKAFLPTVVSSWGESVVQPVVDELVSKFEKRGSADLVAEFTREYPFQVVYRQLGLDQEASALFYRVAMSQTLFRSSLKNAVDAGQKLGSFMRQLIHLRLEEPADDLVTHLAHAEVEGERLPEDVVDSFFRQLLNAGGDTTYRGTSNILAGLLCNPDQLDAVRDDRSLIPQAIDEGLRWESPAMVSPRTVAREVEVGGVVLPAGSTVDVVLGSANRDGTKFPVPDRFDIFRERQVRAFPFATGPHVCIGQHLAKVEMSRALNALFDRLPNLRLDPDKPQPVITGFHLRRLKHLHVLFDT